MVVAMTVEAKKHLDKIDFNVEWGEGEREAIDALTAKENNPIEPIHLQEALQSSEIVVGSKKMQFSTMIDTFDTYVQTSDGRMLSLKGGVDDVPERVQNMIDSPKDNDLAYFIQKVSQFINYNVARGYGTKSDVVDVVSADAILGKQTKRALDGLKYWIENKNDKATFLSIQDLNKLKDEDNLPDGIEYKEGDFVAKDGYERIDPYGTNYAVRKIDVSDVDRRTVEYVDDFGNKIKSITKLGDLPRNSDGQYLWNDSIVYDIVLNGVDYRIYPNGRTADLTNRSMMDTSSLFDLFNNSNKESQVVDVLDISDTDAEADARVDSLRIRIPFANKREMQKAGLIDKDGSIIDPDLYARVDPTDPLNFAVKEKPMKEYLENKGWKVVVEKKGNYVHTYYEKDINGDGKIDRVNQDFALLIQKYGNPFDKNVPLEFAYGVTNHIDYHSSGLTLTSFGLDVLKNAAIVSHFLPYIYGKNRTSNKDVKYIEMKATKVVVLYKTQIVGKDIPSSVQKLRADTGQVFLDGYKHIKEVYDKTTGSWVSLPENRANLIYAQGKLIDITQVDPLQKALYDELKSILSTKIDGTNIYKRGNVELLDKGGSLSFYSYGYETKATKVSDVYVIDGIDKNSISFPVTNLREFVRTLNFINFVKSEFLFHSKNSKYDIVIRDDGGLRLNDFWRHDHGKSTMQYTDVLSSETIKSKFPSLQKRTSALLRYFNDVKKNG